MRIAEHQRAMTIAQEYGVRLDRRSNLNRRRLID